MVMSMLWRFVDWPQVDKIIDGVDVVWCPNIRFLPSSDKVKKIVTIHDLSFLVMPDCYDSKRKIWHWHMNVWENIRKMDGVVAVSQSTANDLIELGKVDEKKIKVIYSGIDGENHRILNGNNYFLFVATLEPRKNVLHLLKAYKFFVEWRKKIGKTKITKLVLAGGQGWMSGDLFDYIKTNGLREFVDCIGFVSEKKKTELILQAKAVYYNSFYEGFGFPPLEAMINNIPVVASFGGSLGEVLRDGVIQVDPFDVYGLMKTMIILTDGSFLKEGIVKKGHEIAQEYSWRKSCQEFRVWLEKIVDGN